MENLSDDMGEKLFDKINDLIVEIDLMSEEFNMTQDQLVELFCRTYIFARGLTEDGKLSPEQEKIINSDASEKILKMASKFMSN